MIVEKGENVTVRLCAFEYFCLQKGNNRPDKGAGLSQRRRTGKGQKDVLPPKGDD